MDDDEDGVRLAAARDRTSATDVVPTAVAAPGVARRTRWRRTVDLAADLGEIAKLVALLLAIAGLVGLYLPGVRTAFETRLNPRAWYYVGEVDRGVFHAEAYQHPPWSGASAPSDALGGVVGTTVVTIGGGLHIGRAAAGGDGPIRTNVAGGVCLHVLAIQRRRAARGDVAYVWLEAVRITC